MNSYVYFYAVLLSVVQLLQDTADGFHSMEAEYRVKDVIYLQVKYPLLVLSLPFSGVGGRVGVDYPYRLKRLFWHD